MNDWVVTKLHSGYVTIKGHNTPEYSKIILLDDIKRRFYKPVGWDSHGQLLYWELPYPVSHTCAVEQEQEDLWKKADDLVRQRP
jgi:hypothetical protein